MTETNTDYPSRRSSMSLPNGTVLSDGKFTIVKQLSSGGFGITYLAKDNVLGRTIVVKECFPEEICQREGKKVVVRSVTKVELLRSITDMFMREARSLACLRHPNIVGVHSAFEENDTAYMALDLIDGQDLLTILDTDSAAIPSPERIKEILIQLLSATGTIHDQDLLHRDISPDNIIIEKSGAPVLIDFGAARAEASRRTRAISSVVVVKDGYSPQEFYVSGSIQTPSSDLYGLAATFYHMISGEAPPNSQIRMAALAGSNPDPCVPLAGRISGYDTGFLEAIDRAMSVLPRDRLQSAREWHDLITQPVGEAVISAPSIDQEAAEPETADLARMLTRLVQEANEDILQSTVAEDEPEQEEKAEPDGQPEPESCVKDDEETFEEDLNDISDAEADLFEDDLETMEDAYEQHDQLISSEYQSDPVETNWAARVIEKRERQLQLTDNEKGRATRFEPTTNSSGQAVIDQPLMIKPLAKYLATGIVIGFVIFALYPSLL